MLTPFTVCLHSVPAFMRHLRSWPSEAVHEALRLHGPSLPRAYRLALMDEDRYRKESYSRGG